MNMIQYFNSSRDVHQAPPIEMAVFVKPGENNMISTHVKKPACCPQNIDLLFVPTQICLPKNVRERVKIESILSSQSTALQSVVYSEGGDILGELKKKSSPDETLRVRGLNVPDGGELCLYISYPADPGQQSELKAIVGTIFIWGYWTTPKPWDLPARPGRPIPMDQNPQTEYDHEAEFIEWVNEGILITEAISRFVKQARKILVGWLLR